MRITTCLTSSIEPFFEYADIDAAFAMLSRRVVLAAAPLRY
jgi:hypothetical protein